MTQKPPSSLATGEDLNPDEADDNLLVDVDASEDVTVEASEEVTQEAASVGLSAVPDETPVPAAAAAQEAPAAPTPRQTVPTLLGIPLPSIPLPGVMTAPAKAAPSDDDDDETADGIEIAKEEESDEEVTRLARPVNDEVTRPSITDEDEEETKVEATDPLIKVDNGGDDVTTALAEQASVEREKALRRSSPSLPASAMPPGETSDVEFADPDDADDDGHDSPTASYSDAAPETSPLAAAITRRPPPGAPFGRLPGPSSSFGLSLSPSPVGQVPAPSSSPFASRLPASTGARTTTGSGPVVQIPAPSAAAPVAPQMSPLRRLVFTKYSIPVGGLAIMTLTTLIIGLMIGGALFSHGGPPPVVVATPAPAPVTGPVVQPVAVQPPKLESPAPHPPRSWRNRPRPSPSRWSSGRWRRGRKRIRWRTTCRLPRRASPRVPPRRPHPRAQAGHQEADQGLGRSLRELTPRRFAASADPLGATPALSLSAERTRAR